MKQSIATLLVAAGIATTPALTFAADPFPTKAVRIVVPYLAGGPFDVLMRALGQKLAEEWKQQVLIENKPGANEAIGADVVAKSPPDGYTLLAASEAAFILNRMLFSKLAYNPEKDFAPVTQIVDVPMVFFVPARFPANNAKEFVALAKSRAAAGNPVVFGSSGIGGPSHLPIAILARDNDLKLTHVPYKGGVQVIQDMIGGQIELGVLAASGVEPHIKSNAIKGLAVSAPQRLPSLPQVPTFAESGIKDPRARFIVGLAAPAGTPAEVVEKIAGSVAKVMKSPEFQAKYLDPYSFLPVASTPAQFKQYLDQERPLQADRVKVSGAKLD